MGFSIMFILKENSIFSTLSRYFCLNSVIKPGLGRKQTSLGVRTFCDPKSPCLYPIRVPLRPCPRCPRLGQCSALRITPFYYSHQKCAEINGELPIPRNFDDVNALGEVMEIFNTTKIWAAVVDGDLGYQNGDQKFRNYYTYEYLSKYLSSLLKGNTKSYQFLR